MNGFHRIATAVPQVALTRPKANAERIGELYRAAEADGVALLLTPELSLTGYSCGDLFFREDLRREALEALEELRRLTGEPPADQKTGQTGDRTILVVGLPLLVGNRLYNCAAVLQNGRVSGCVPKSHLPNYAEYYEKRWFSSAFDLPPETDTVILPHSGGQPVPFGTNLVFTLPGSDFSFGVEICEDLWVPTPISSALAEAGARLIVNLSASTEFLGKAQTRRARVLAQSAAIEGAYALAAAGPGESTADAIFGGQTLIADGGRLLAESPLFPRQPCCQSSVIDFAAIAHRRLRFSGWGPRNQASGPSGHRTVLLDPVPACEPDPVSQTPFLDAFGEPGWEHKLLELQAVGLAERLRRTGLGKVVLGVSGGADSALALLGSLKAVSRLAQTDSSSVIAVVMPGYGSTDATQHTAAALARALGCETRIVDIRPACHQHFADIRHSESTYDLTFENVQARERTQILMDIANAECALVVGTGDLSEIALGWSTYNGDHMSMYALNASIPKTMVYAALRGLAADYSAAARAELIRVAGTPASPELVPGAPADGTESRIGPYAIHDFLLYHTLVDGSGEKALRALATAAFRDTYPPETRERALANFLRRFRTQQFKRNCVPDGPKITLSLSPRADWRMPSDC